MGYRAKSAADLEADQRTVERLGPIELAQRIAYWRKRRNMVDKGSLKASAVVSSKAIKLWARNRMKREMDRIMLEVAEETDITGQTADQHFRLFVEGLRQLLVAELYPRNSFGGLVGSPRPPGRPSGFTLMEQLQWLEGIYRRKVELFASQNGIALHADSGRNSVLRILHNRGGVHFLDRAIPGVPGTSSRTLQKRFERARKKFRVELSKPTSGG